MDSCINGNLFEVLRLLRYMGKLNINDAMLNVVASNNNNDLKIVIIQTLFQSKLVSIKTVNECLKIENCPTDVKNLLNNFIKNADYNTHIV